MTDQMPIAIIDVETSGLEPHIHRVWEIATLVDGIEDVFQVALDEQAMFHADPVALEIGGWATRADTALQVPLNEAVVRIAQATMGRIIVGKNPEFDVRMILATFQIEGPVPWHYRRICVDQLAYGALISRGVEVGLPWKSDELAGLLGCSVPEEERHTALGDVRLCKQMWDAVHAMGAA